MIFGSFDGTVLVTVLFSFLHAEPSRFCGSQQADL